MTNQYVIMLVGIESLIILVMMAVYHFIDISLSNEIIANQETIIRLLNGTVMP